MNDVTNAAELYKIFLELKETKREQEYEFIPKDNGKENTYGKTQR